MKSLLRFPAVIGLLLCSSFPWDSDAWAGPPAASPASSEDPAPASESVSIPGPLRSFLRMAAISQKVSTDEITPLLARNVFLLGYEGPQSQAHPTEFLVLLNRYVQQARDLVALGGSEGVIHASNCEDVKPLLQVLGYRVRPDCGQHSTYLETVDPQRAFLTIDSGFPLPELEKALQEGKPFSYTYPTSRAPALFSDADWAGAKRNGKDSKDLIDTILHDPMLARLYWGMARMDVETRTALRQSPGLKKLEPYGAVLDFYGSHIRIRAGRVQVPGGSRAEPGWKELVGASPDSPGDFVPHLLAKDNGWLAAYYDSLSRVNSVQQAHFTEPKTLRRYYEAVRGKDSSGDAARGVFRADPRLLLLLTRLQWEPNGDPYVPGNLDAWKRILHQKSDSNLVRYWGRRAKNFDNPQQLLEAMFALSRVQLESGPLQAYLMTSDLDSRRSPGHRLSPDTVVLLASKYSEFSDQYLMFSEFPTLDDSSITTFLDVAGALNNIHNQNVRGNAMGTFEASVGLWQILARQGQIPDADLNASFDHVVRPFAKVNTAPQLFDAGRDSLKQVLIATTGKPEGSQDVVIDLLAGPPQDSPEGQRMHQAIANRIRSVLDAQRLVSLDTLIALGDGLHDVASVKANSSTLLSLAGELREFEMPQPIFRSSERDQWAAGIYNNRHTEMQMKADLTKVVKSPNSADQLAEARGQIAPVFRDTLVGLNYAYYEPPGAQILHNNPLFVRSHDFAGDTVTGVERQAWQAAQLFGAGSPAGGGARLVGSLADLPYVLADAEQDFIAPENVQALIWRQVVPGLLTSAVVPRWWGVSPNELHAIALYQQAGEELLTNAAQNEQQRKQVLDILSERMVPLRSERVEERLRAGNAQQAIAHLLPADSFYLAAEYRRRFPDSLDSFGSAGHELDALIHQHPEEVGWQRLSRDFGTPHPAMAQSYGRELLNVPPFPAFMGYSSRFLAESWDSNNLYWARLADEKGYSPVMLNRLVPELTRRMVEKIFATDLEDWQALLRAAHEAGDEFRQGKIASATPPSALSAP
jgi:hypothetical protein